MKTMLEGERTMSNAKKILAVVTVIALIFTCALADFAIVSGTSSLNLREGPGYDYNIIGTAARGDWVEVNGDTDGWYSVSVVKNNNFGYMDSNYLSFGSGGSDPSTTTGVVANQSPSAFLNLREYPSYSANVLGIYYNGAVCTILSTYSSGWYEVEIDGMHGYFRSEYIKVNGGSSTTATVTASSGSTVNLREGPSTSYGVLYRVPIGSRVSVLLKGNNFWKIRYNGLTGYMSSSFLSSGYTPAPTAVPYTSGYAVVSNISSYQSVNMRAQPSTSAQVLAQYSAGTRFQVVAQGKTWCKLYGTASGRTGYIMTKYLTLYNLPSTPTKRVNNGNSYVNLRSAPSKATGSVLVQVPSGSTVTVMIPGDEWTQVRYNGVTGYMMTYFLK